MTSQDNDPLTQTRLRELLDYNPETGEFTWKVTRRGRAAAGSVAGSPIGNGYIRVHVDGRKYRAHRLAFFYMTGEWPKDEVDHKDLNKSNNAWDNLRESTHTQNMQNRPAWGSVPLKGVRLHECGKYEAKIVISKKQHIIGYFSTPEAAHDAYCVASNENFDEFARAA